MMKRWVWLDVAALLLVVAGVGVWSVPGGLVVAGVGFAALNAHLHEGDDGG